MGIRDSRYKLSEFIELDDGFFETVDKESKEEDRKRDRGKPKTIECVPIVN